MKSNLNIFNYLLIQLIVQNNRTVEPTIHSVLIKRNLAELILQSITKFNSLRVCAIWVHVACKFQDKHLSSITVTKYSMKAAQLQARRSERSAEEA